MSEPKKEPRPNPYFKRRESQSQDKEAPILARLPHHYFSSPEGMFKELLRYEACIAHIPNTDPDFPFAFHVAFVSKDENDKVYSIGLQQHHGEPNPNFKGFNNENSQNQNRPKVYQKNRPSGKAQRKFNSKKSKKTHKQ